VVDALNGEEVVIDVASGGGDVWAGSDIYAALKSYSGRVVINIPSIAASSASVIAAAGDEVNIGPTAQIMIHNVSNAARGDYRAMNHQAEVLENYNKSIANAYRLKTGLPEAELLEMMNKETWLTAQQAVEMGFADKIMFDNDLRLVAGGFSNVLPQEIINKMRNSKDNPSFKAAEARLTLLKLKGENHV
jgi:ATP-dependent protease ClpP protease subunit